MGLLSTLFERRDSFSVSEHLPDSHWFWRWLGGRSEAGVVVNEQTALNTLMFASCVMLLADTYATVPLGVYRKLEPRGRETARNHSLYRVLATQPNPTMNSFTYRHLQMVHLATWGNSYSEIERTRGDVRALWPFHPSAVRPYQRSDRSLWYEVTEGTTKRDIPAENMLHIRGLATQGLMGLTPLTMMRQAIGIAVAAEEYGARFFANDARPSVLLKHPMTLSEEARQNLKTSWEETHGGSNRGGVAILEEGLDVATLSVPPDDAQFIQTRQFEARQIAGFFRVPPHLISDVERSTSWGTGIEQQQIAFVVYTMQAWFTRAEQEMNRVLLPENEQNRYYVKFNLNGLMRGDSAARKEFYATGRQWGYMSANDVRELEDMNPIPNGDVYLQPLNMVEAGAQSDPSPDPDAEPERSAGPSEFRSAREERSVTARRRLANAHVAVYRDAIGRLIRIEQQEVGKAVRTHLRERSADSFEAWLRDYYYERLPQRAVENLRAPVASLMTAVAAEVLDELGADELPDGDLDAFALGYVETFAQRHAGTSRSRLLKLLNEWRADSDDAGTLPDLVDEELDTWDERVDPDAEDEAHRSSNAASKYVYGALGVLLFRWVATGSDPCDYCSAMNGRTASGDSAFLNAGQSFAPGGIRPLVSQSSIGHPPLHRGCQCVIAPG